MATNEQVIFDLSNYKEKSSARVDEGRYKGQIEDVEYGKSSNNNPMITVWIRILGGEFDGATIVDRLTLSDKAMFRVVNFLGALGIPTPKKKFTMNIRKWVGKMILMDLADGEPYNGRVKSEVQGYLRAVSPNAEQGEDLDELGGEDEEETPETNDRATDLPDVDDEPTPDDELAAADEEPAEEAPKKSKPKPAADDDLDLDEVDL